MTVLMVLSTVGGGCATTAVPRLPSPLAGEDDTLLLAAHTRLDRSYQHCKSEYEAESIPVPVLLTIATATATVGALAAAGALAFVLPQPYDAAGAAGAATGAAAMAGITVLFGADILPFYERADVRAASLQKARTTAQKALRTRDPDEVDRVTRRLYENCRVAEVTPSGDAASTVMRDLERYRREADGQRRWVKTMEGQRKLEQEELEGLRNSILQSANEAPDATSSTPPPAPQGKIVARVGGVSISASALTMELQAHALRMPSDPNPTLTALTTVVFAELATQRAPMLGVSLSTEDWQRIRADAEKHYGGAVEFAAEVARSGRPEADTLAPFVRRATFDRVHARYAVANASLVDTLISGAPAIDVRVTGITLEDVVRQGRLNWPLLPPVEKASD